MPSDPPRRHGPGTPSPQRARPWSPGGVIHTYQKYDPQRLPPPNAQGGSDLASAAMEHMLMFGDTSELTDEQLARAVHLDPSQIQGLGPSLDALIALLLERKRKILETYETDSAQSAAAGAVRERAARMRPPEELRQRFRRAVMREQIRDLNRLWYEAEESPGRFPTDLLHLIEQMGLKYQVDQLAADYSFTGRTPLSIDEAIRVKEELEQIDELLEQLRRAREDAQVGLIDMQALAEFAEPGDLEQLSQLQQQVQAYLRQMAEAQGLERKDGAYRLTPKAMRVFQNAVLARLFASLQASRTGRHTGPVAGDGAVELQRTKAYEFGDSVANLDVPASLTNAMVRAGGASLPVRLKPEDLEVHRTRNTPKCATVVVMDMSGSMRYDGQYIHCKRMGLALDGLIRKQFPGDFLRFVEMYTFAKPRHLGEVAALLPKIPTIQHPVVRLKADMSDPGLTESMIHPHFTNIQHGLLTARRLLATQDTPNRQVVLITDGLPTAHFEGQTLFMLYPPDSRTERATLREGAACARQGITINIFLVPSWSQTREDIHFAYRLAESTTGRVFFTAGRDLDRYVVWDYVSRRREILS